MTTRFLVTTAMALCLFGCAKPTSTTETPSVAAPAPPPAASASLMEKAAPAPTTTPVPEPEPAAKPVTAPTEEIITTASGLKYQVLKRGDGAVSPKATDMVTVHYTGMLTDGTVFDSSVQRGQPASFPLNRVIPGWTEGLQYMKVGDKFKFTIPAALAYGQDSPPGSGIPPNSTLVFDVELLGIQ